MALPKPCERCGKRMIRSSRYTKICEKCRNKSFKLGILKTVAMRKNTLKKTKH
jgi:hypothetical protein